MAKSKSLVKDYMTKNVVTVSPQTTTEEVIKLMKESDHNSSHHERRISCSWANLRVQ